MAASFAMHSAQMHIQQQHRLDQQLPKTPIECTCGAQAFRDQHALDRQQRQLKRVTPTGGKLPTSATKYDTSLRSEKQRATQPEADQDDATPVPRKRSLWRKLLGKPPKCICEELRREREALKLKPIAIPSEYEGCVTVRVAGKQVAYTREMQLIKRRSYTPMDAISEDED